MKMLQHIIVNDTKVVEQIKKIFNDLITANQSTISELDPTYVKAVEKWFNSNFKNWTLKRPGHLFVTKYRTPHSALALDTLTFHHECSNVELMVKAILNNCAYEVDVTSNMWVSFMASCFEYIINCRSEFKDISRVSVEDIIYKVNTNNAETLEELMIEERVVSIFENGWVVLELINEQSIRREGHRMSNCLRTQSANYFKKIKKGHMRLFSLRDANNNPHVTIDVTTSEGNHELVIHSIKGNRNMPPKEEYNHYIRQFFVNNAVFRAGEWSESTLEMIGIVRFRDRLYINNSDEHLKAINYMK